MALVAGLLKKADGNTEVKRNKKCRGDDDHVWHGRAMELGGHMAPACPCRSAAVHSSGAAGVNRGAAGSLLQSHSFFLNGEILSPQVIALVHPTAGKVSTLWGKRNNFTPSHCTHRKSPNFPGHSSTPAEPHEISKG